MDLLENNITVQQRIEELENTIGNQNKLAILRKLEKQERVTPMTLSHTPSVPSNTKKSMPKKKRCPKGTRRNPKTGACEPTKQVI